MNSRLGMVIIHHVKRGLEYRVSLLPIVKTCHQSLSVSRQLTQNLLEVEENVLAKCISTSTVTGIHPYTMIGQITDIII